MKVVFHQNLRIYFYLCTSILRSSILLKGPNRILAGNPTTFRDSWSGSGRLHNRWYQRHRWRASSAATLPPALVRLNGWVRCLRCVHWRRLPYGLSPEQMPVFCPRVVIERTRRTRCDGPLLLLACFQEDLNCGDLPLPRSTALSCLP